jgi:hypothetical protein
MGKIYIALLTVLSIALHAGAMDGRWRNSGETPPGFPENLQIRGEYVKARIKTTHGTKESPSVRSIGESGCRALTIRGRRGLLLLMLRKEAGERLLVYAQRLYNTGDSYSRSFLFVRSHGRDRRFALAGRWINSTPHTGSIYRLKIARENGRVKIKAFRLCGSKKCPIGKSEAVVRSDGTLRAVFDDGVERFEIYARGIERKGKGGRGRYSHMRVDIRRFMNRKELSRETVYMLRER